MWRVQSASEGAETNTITVARSGSDGAVSPTARGIAVQSLVKRNNRSQGGVTPFPVTCKRLGNMASGALLLAVALLNRFACIFRERRVDLINVLGFGDHLFHDQIE